METRLCRIFDDPRTNWRSKAFDSRFSEPEESVVESSDDQGCILVQAIDTVVQQTRDGEVVILSNGEST
jgi:hypothetical protein